jgi:hypothetical protein
MMRSNEPLSSATHHINTASHSTTRRTHTWQLQRLLEVVKDEFRKHAEPVIVLQQDQLWPLCFVPRSLLTQRVSLHKT